VALYDVARSLGVTMANERLRLAMVAAGVSVEELARRVEVDPKTVERWISKGRVPHRRHRWSAGQVLGADETDLWPGIEDSAVRSAGEAEFVRLYPHRGAVPQSLWTSLIDAARQKVDVLVYAGLFLFDSNPDLGKTLVNKGRSGAQARLLFGEPQSRVVIDRGDEEGIGEGLVARVRTSLRYLGAVHEQPGVEVRLHDTVLVQLVVPLR
jgi:transcriptional regulator with XRE-family HTH domain